MQYMPLSEEKRLELFKELLEWTMPVFQDRTILLLMILLSIFDLENDENVKRVRKYVLSILRCYLQSKRKECLDVDMNNIMGCIKSLQKVLMVFKNIGCE